MGRGGRKKGIQTEPWGPLLQSLPEGAELWLVGGAVRSRLLGEEATDHDLALGGMAREEAEEWLGSLGQTEPLEIAGQRVGWRLRTPWTPAGGLEIALLRRENSTGPAHTDFQTDTDGVTIEEDLSRRDFTCNAIALDLQSGKTRDPYGGAQDIQSGTLRALGEHAFREDPLRVLRGAVRQARDGMNPDEQTLCWMRDSSLHTLSPERVWAETHKIVSAPGGAEALRTLRDAGVAQQIFPELSEMWGFDQESPYHRLTCDEHCLRALELCDSPDPATRWAALLHDIGKPASAWRGPSGRLHYYANPKKGKRDHAEVGAELAAELLDRLRAPRDLREDVVYLVQNHMWADARGWDRRGSKKQGIIARRFLARHGDRWRALLDLRHADASAKGRDASDELAELGRFRERLEEEAGGSWQRPEIDGHDLSRLGLRGPAVGRALQEIQSRLIDSPELNERERLLGWAEKMAREELSA